jgi:hypothetical protein
MSVGLAMASVDSTSNVVYQSVLVVALLPNGSGAKIETVTGKLHSSTESYEMGQRQFNLYMPQCYEHVEEYKTIMSKFSIKKVSFLILTKKQFFAFSKKFDLFKTKTFIYSSDPP